jgi:imidazolonepropionase-like amidohydrolase
MRNLIHSSGLLLVGFLAVAGVIMKASNASAQNPEIRFRDGPLPIGSTPGVRYERLVIRNAIVVSGRGTPGSNRAMPPEGPIDIVIEGNKIVDMVPFDPVNAAGYGEDFGRPTGDRVIDAAGMYVLPGLIELHAHLRGNGGSYGPDALGYAYRLYIAHGVTTVRDAGTGAGLETMTEQRRLSEANDIVAPRLVLCQRWPLPLRHWDAGNTPDAAREMVREFQRQGADCVKVSKSPGHYPDVLEAIVAEADQLGMPVMVDLKVSETDAVVASNAGVASIEHWYGVPDAALPGTQNFPTDYNYWNELDRFRWAGNLWTEASQYPEKLIGVLETMIENGTAWVPTMTVYESDRDFSRYMTLPWRETLMHPNEAAEWGADTTSHGGYKTEWKTSDEIMWKRNFRLWMDYVLEFKERGGLLGVGSDAGAMGGLFMIRELELMQEAGIHPIDIIKLATTNAAQVLGRDDLCGVRVGCTADLAIVNGNPIDNMRVMYGMGYGFYGIAPAAEQADWGGVRWTIKDGIVFDARALLREVRGYVEQEKRRLEMAAAELDG